MKKRQRGSAMIEFAIVGPLITLIGTTVLQYSLMFNAKNMVNHASFMAARAGSTANAKLGTIENAYARALIPLYGGGRDTAELAQAYAKTQADLVGNVKFELINPTKESFDDWGDNSLKQKYGARAIPNGSLAFKNPSDVKGNSGQSIQDANLVKLKISHGYELKVPLAGSMIQFMMKWMDGKKDPFTTRLYENRRIPLVSHVTLQMQSDPIEPTNPVSIAGLGNNGDPTNPGFTEDPVKSAPNCQTVGCTVMSTPPTPVDPNNPTNPAGPVCLADHTIRGELQADVLFDFGQSTLTAAGKQELDNMVTALEGQTYDTMALTGHTDQLGSDSLNAQLSQSRAQAVKDYLVSKGLSGQTISVDGKGASEPIVALSSCPSSGQAQKDCLAPNRRVGFEVTGVSAT